MEAYGKKTSRTTNEKMVRCCGRRPVQNGSLRLEGISTGQRQMEGFSDGGENS